MTPSRWSDLERPPLNATALYRDEPRKIWRSDVQRVSAIGLDQPKAACIITGI